MWSGEKRTVWGGTFIKKTGQKSRGREKTTRVDFGGGVVSLPAKPFSAQGWDALTRKCQGCAATDREEMKK